MHPITPTIYCGHYAISRRRRLNFWVTCKRVGKWCISWEVERLSLSCNLSINGQSGHHTFLKPRKRLRDSAVFDNSKRNIQHRTVLLPLPRRAAYTVAYSYTEQYSNARFNLIGRDLSILSDLFIDTNIEQGRAAFRQVCGER